MQKIEIGVVSLTTIEFAKLQFALQELEERIEWRFVHCNNDLTRAERKAAEKNFKDLDQVRYCLTIIANARIPRLATPENQLQIELISE